MKGGFRDHAGDICCPRQGYTQRKGKIYFCCGSAVKAELFKRIGGGLWMSVQIPPAKTLTNQLIYIYSFYQYFYVNLKVTLRLGWGTGSSQGAMHKYIHTHIYTLDRFRVTSPPWEETKEPRAPRGICIRIKKHANLHSDNNPSSGSKPGSSLK